MGDATAITLGRNLTRYRHGYLVLSSLMVGFVVYSAGMIGFVGLICPHVMRMLTGAEHRRLLPASAFAGAILRLLDGAPQLRLRRCRVKRTASPDFPEGRFSFLKIARSAP